MFKLINDDAYKVIDDFYKENIKVPAGTVVTIGPVTPENGKPVQITITFGQDSNGNTTAEVATTQRPDLTPGGSEAPNTKPDPDPSSNLESLIKSQMINPIQMVILINVQMISLMMIHLIKGKKIKKKTKKMTRKKNQKVYFVIFFQTF